MIEDDETNFSNVKSNKFIKKFIRNQLKNKKLIDNFHVKSKSVLYKKQSQTEDDVIFVDDTENINSNNNTYIFKNDDSENTFKILPISYSRFLQFLETFVLTKQQSNERISYYKHHSFCPPPLFIISICIINFIFCLNYQGDAVYDNYLYLFPHSNKDKNKEIWRLFTYSLLHYDWCHFAANNILLFLFGLPLELVHGWFRLLTIYVIGAISGGLLHSIYDPEFGLIGCSAALFGILACHISNLFINWREMECKMVRILLVVAVAGTLIGLYVHSKYNDSSSLISDLSHVGGAFSGLCMGTVLLKNLIVTKLEKKVGIIAMVIFILIFIYYLSKYLK